MGGATAGDAGDRPPLLQDMGDSPPLSKFKESLVGTWKWVIFRMDRILPRQCLRPSRDISWPLVGASPTGGGGGRSESS